MERFIEYVGDMYRCLCSSSMKVYVQSYNWLYNFVLGVHLACWGVIGLCLGSSGCSGFHFVQLLLNFYFGFQRVTL